MTTNNIIEIDKPIDTLAWLEKRHRYNDKCIVGSSEVSVVMGANEYETIVDLAVRKLQPVQSNPPTDAMTRGNVLEPALIQHARNEMNIALETPNVMYLHNDVIATLDARGTGEHKNIVVEAKTNNRWTLGNDVPTTWWWQAQAQMYCTDTEVVNFVVLDKHMRLGMQQVERSNDGIAQMVERVSAFCEAINDERLPDDSVLTAPQVAALYKQPAGVVELTADAFNLIGEWEAIKACLKEYEEREKQVKDAIANLMREHEFASVNGQRVLSYKAQSTSRLDSKALATAHPELVQQYTTASTFRVLRITK